MAHDPFLEICQLREENVRLRAQLAQAEASWTACDEERIGYHERADRAEAKLARVEAEQDGWENGNDGQQMSKIVTGALRDALNTHADPSIDRNWIGSAAKRITRSLWGWSRTWRSAYAQVQAAEGLREALTAMKVQFAFFGEPGRPHPDQQRDREVLQRAREALAAYDAAKRPIDDIPKRGRSTT